MGFKTSVNIKFDIGKVEFIKRYLPTPSHAEALKGIIDGFITEGAGHAHIILGPYGTGKSLIANVLSSIVSRMVDELEITSLVNKFEQVDDHVAEDIRALSTLKTNYIPILLSGNEGRFRQSIISNIVRKLKEHGIDVVLPGLSTKIIDAIRIWEEQYPEAYLSFKLKVEQDGKILNKWMDQIKKQDENEIKYFSDIYPHLTRGATFEIDYDHSFISQIEFLVDVLEKNNLGIFIVYDEFARFLQGLSGSKINEAMQDLQDLAELANRTSQIHFLLITHRNLRHYFNNSDDEQQKEFQRIQKRFRQYLVKSDQATFLRIAEIILLENLVNKPAIPENTFQEVQSQMRSFPLFPSINQTERDQLIIRSMFPLHPVALFLLPHLTRVFGQNERTLFTFLESQETGGLINHIEKSNYYYLAHQLFDFFFQDVNDSYNQDTAEHILLYKKALARMPEEIPNKIVTHNLVKLTTLWNLCGLQSQQKLTTEFLIFATQIDENELRNTLIKLTENKVMRFNRINNYWELFSGSSVDLDESIDIEKQTINIEPTVQINVLGQILPKKHYYPERFNDEKGMTRFASVHFIFAKDIIEGRYEPVEVFSDLHIYYVLPSLEDNREELEVALKNLSLQKERLFFLCWNPFESVRETISNYLALNSLKNNKLFISEDKGIKEELEVIITETKYSIMKYLSPISSFDNESKWFSDGRILRINSELELTSILTEKCYELYRSTPVILSDTFNRCNISGVQKNAGINLINNILENGHEEQFCIEGSGPEYALYAAIFKNNDRFDTNVNNLDYTSIANDQFKLLREKLIEQLEKYPSGTLQDIVNIFSKEPFGIRKPLIPILLVAMLRDRWNEFMLYNKGMYVPGINGSKLFEIIVEVGPENYEYVYERLEESYIDFFNKIEMYFRDSIEDRLINSSRIIFICGTLLKWLRSLPYLTQTSEEVDKEFQQFRSWIRTSEIDPQHSIAELYNLFNNNFDKLLDLKMYAESFLTKVKERLAKVVLEKIDVRDYSELQQWAEQFEVSIYQNKQMEKLAHSVINEHSESWLTRFAESYIGVKINEWSDTTLNLFIDQLTYDFQPLNLLSDDSDEQDNESVVKIQLENNSKTINRVELSVKSTTIYTNLERMINTAGSNVPRQELEYLIYMLFENYVVNGE